MSMLNPKTNRAKIVARRNFDRQVTWYELRWEKDIKKFLDHQMNEAARAMENGELSPEDAIDTAKFQKNTASWIHEISYYFARQAWNDSEAQGIKSFGPENIKAPKHNAFFRWVNYWTQVRSGVLISQVTNTTKKLIRKIINNGMMNGLSNYQIAKSMRDAKLIVNRRRAITIARTETHSAAVGGYDNAMRTAGVELKKEWNSSRDKRTRPHHMVSPVVPMRDDFVIWGENLRWPGDPMGSARNVINCRCVVLYHSNRA